MTQDRNHQRKHLEDDHTYEPESVRHSAKSHDCRPSTKGQDLALEGSWLHCVHHANVRIVQRTARQGQVLVGLSQVNSLSFEFLWAPTSEAHSKCSQDHVYAHGLDGLIRRICWIDQWLQEIIYGIYWPCLEGAAAIWHSARLLEPKSPCEDCSLWQLPQRKGAPLSHSSKVILWTSLARSLSGHLLVDCHVAGLEMQDISRTWSGVSVAYSWVPSGGPLCRQQSPWHWPRYWWRMGWAREPQFNHWRVRS